MKQQYVSPSLVLLQTLPAEVIATSLDEDIIEDPF